MRYIFFTIIEPLRGSLQLEKAINQLLTSPSVTKRKMGFQVKEKKVLYG
jgi:hypothetical protein